MEKAKVTIHVSVSATPEPAATPTTPQLFLDFAEAEASLDAQMRSEWETNAPTDDDGEKEPYPDTWEEAHDAMAAANDDKFGDDELWGEYRLTSHEVELPLDKAVPRPAYDEAIGALKELATMAEGAGVAIPRQVADAIAEADALAAQELGQ